jgi:hypothetical protein
MCLEFWRSRDEKVTVKTMFPKIMTGGEKQRSEAKI